MNEFIAIATTILSLAAAATVVSPLEQRLGRVWSFLGIGDDAP